MRSLNRARLFAFVSVVFVAALFGVATSPAFAGDDAPLMSDAASQQASPVAGVAAELGSPKVSGESAEVAVNAQSAVEEPSTLLEVAGLSVQAHVQGKGWLAAVGQGVTAGTTGQSRRLEALKLTLSLTDGATKQ